MSSKFPAGVAEKIGWYVYRLIDPRNGETFYVGKGRGDRVFEHARGLQAAVEEDTLDLKFSRIRDITASGFEVAHLIHQHGIPDEKTAYRVEAAVIDCFPGLTNKVAGHGARDFGVRHVEQIIEQFAAEPFVPCDELISISIAQSYKEAPLYESVRGIWKIDVERARKQDLVLAVIGSIVRGVYRPTQWVPATMQNFPHLSEDVPGRFGFVGVEGNASERARYLGKRVPEKYRHSQNPIRFIPREIDTPD